MEVLSGMSMPVHLSQVQNATGHADESEHPRTAPVQAAPFSRVFNQRVRECEKKEDSPDPSTTSHPSTRDASSMKQSLQTRQQEQQPREERTGPAENETTPFKQNSPDEINDSSEPAPLPDDTLGPDNLSTSDGDRKPLSGTTLLNLPWTQVVIPADNFSLRDTNRPFLMNSAPSDITIAEFTVPAFNACAKAGFIAEAQGYGPIEQQSAADNPSGNAAADPAESSGIIQESAFLKGLSFPSGITLNRHFPGGAVPGAVGVAASNGNAMEQGNNPVQSQPAPASAGSGESSLLPDELQKADIIPPTGTGAGKTLQGTSTPTINFESVLEGNEPVNEGRSFAQGVLGKTEGLVSQAAVEARSSGKAKMRTLDSGTQLQESNGIVSKPGPNGVETGKGPISFDGGAKTPSKEAEGNNKNWIIEEKPANSSTTLFVHGQGEARTREASTLSNPANDGKLPSPEQICHQVREKLESGDYGSNKSSITLKLHPEELGELRINLRMEELRLKVDIVTENRSVKEALMQNLDALKDTLSRQNISMDLFNVSADIRQGFQRGSGDENSMMQHNRAANAHVRTKETVEDSLQPVLNYNWGNDSSLVSLVL